MNTIESTTVIRNCTTRELTIPLGTTVDIHESNINTLVVYGTVTISNNSKIGNLHLENQGMTTISHSTVKRISLDTDSLIGLQHTKVNTLNVIGERCSVTCEHAEVTFINVNEYNRTTSVKFYLESTLFESFVANQARVTGSINNSTITGIAKQCKVEWTVSNSTYNVDYYQTDSQTVVYRGLKTTNRHTEVMKRAEIRVIDGNIYFVGYKTFGSYYPAPNTWTLEEGSTITEGVNDNPSVNCGSGINAVVSEEELLKMHRYINEYWELLIPITAQIIVTNEDTIRVSEAKLNRRIVLSE